MERKQKDLKVNKEKVEEMKRKENFYAKNSEIKIAFYTNKSMLVLLYKETLLNINDLDFFFVYCCFFFIYRSSRIYSPMMVQVVCHPRRQRSFIAKWRN